VCALEVLHKHADLKMLDAKGVRSELEKK
jgi:hypothetical protein